MKNCQELLCGIDEVGRGPLAGPVVAACVHIPPEIRKRNWIAEIKDSKKLSAARRESLFALITEHCAVGLAEISPAKIDEINILQATLKAMEGAFLIMSSPPSSLSSPPSSLSSPRMRGSRAPKNRIPGQAGDDVYGAGDDVYGAGDDVYGAGDDMIRAESEKTHWTALIDGNHIPANLPCPARAIIKGDSKSKSIGAASIVAKVTRDRYMAKLALEYPHYGWERNAGYGTREHLEAIARHGITPHHRRSFAPVKKFLENTDRSVY